MGSGEKSVVAKWWSKKSDGEGKRESENERTELMRKKYNQYLLINGENVGFVVMSAYSWFLFEWK